MFSIEDAEKLGLNKIFDFQKNQILTIKENKMEKYLGVKLIKAEPCSHDQFAGAKNRGDLSKLSGGIDQDGYKVVYEDGYTSWSPKDVFEKAYKNIADGDKVLIEFDLKTGNWELIKYC